MPVVVAPNHVFHDVATGVWCGVTEASDELPARAEILATACAAAGAQMVEAEVWEPPDAVVVSLGVDAAADDPNSPLQVSDVGFNAVGRMIAELDRATVRVHEGGYMPQSLAGHTLAVLGGFES